MRKLFPLTFSDIELNRFTSDSTSPPQPASEHRQSSSAIIKRNISEFPPAVPPVYRAHQPRVDLPKTLVGSPVVAGRSAAGAVSDLNH
jgi:hypothetical protein